MMCLSILGYQIMELSGDGSKNTKKTGILSLKGKKDGMPKKKQKTKMLLIWSANINIIPIIVLSGFLPDILKARERRPVSEPCRRT